MRHNIFIFILLLLVLILAACARLPDSELSPEDEKVATIEECEIKNAAERTDCYLAFAVNTSHAGLCEFIDGRTHNFCVYEVAKTSLAVSDASCTAISNDTYWSDRCYMEVSLRNAEFEVLEDNQGCDKVQDEELQDACFAGVALDTENVVVCDRVRDGFRYQNCLYDIAKIAYRPDVCLLLFDATNHDICLSRLAKLTEDPTVCNLIVTQNSRESCKNYFSLRTR